MKIGLHKHIDFKAKNPFMGEGMLVFANTPDGPPSAPMESANNHNFHVIAQAGPKQKDIERLETLYPKKDKNASLKKIIDDYRMVRGGMEYLEKINSYLQTTTEPVDAGALPWSKTGDSINQGVERLKEQVKSLNLNVDTTIFTRIKGEEEREQKRQVVEYLSALYENLGEESAKIAQKVHEEYIKIYVREFEELERAWDSQSPVFQDYAKEKKLQYAEVKKNLKEQIDTPIPLGEEDRLIELLQNFQNIIEKEKDELREMQMQLEKPVSVKKITDAFKALQEKKNKEFPVLNAQYKEKTAKILVELNRLKSEVEQSGQISEDEKNKRIKKIDQLIKDYGKNLQSADVFNEEDFSDPEWLMEKDENGEEVNKTIKNTRGEDINVPKGLKERIDLLNSQSLHPDALNYLCNGILEEINQINHSFETFKAEAETGLDQNVEKAKTLDVLGPVQDAEYGFDSELIWVSPMDIWTMATNAKDAFMRSFERTRNRKVGRLGKRLTSSLENLNFGPFKHFGVIPGDLAKKEISAENEAVSFYQNDYKSNDDNSVINLLREARNQDQFKACLLLLGERGRINWFDPLFIKQMNRFQKVIHFNHNNVEDFYNNSTAYYQNLALAFKVIFGDSDFFRNLNAQSQSAYASGKEKFKQELYNMSRARGGLQILALSILKSHIKSKGASNENPQKFEYVVELGIIGGAIQPPELGLYLLVQGAMHGLLPFERLHELYANKAADMPYLEVFNEGIFNYSNLKQWASIDPPSEDIYATITDGKAPHKFMRWFHTFVMHNPRVKNRISSVLQNGRGTIDPDYLPLFLPYSNEDPSAPILQITPQGQGPSDWLLNNATQYHLLALHNQLAHMDELENEQAGKMDSIHSKDELSMVITNFIKWDSIMANRMFMNKSQRYARYTDSLMKQEPRSASFVDGIFWESGKKENSTMYGYVEETRKLISQLDPELFSIIFKDGQPNPSDIAKAVNILKTKYEYKFLGGDPQDADTFYEKTSGFIRTIIEKQSNISGTLNTLIEGIKRGHQEFYDNYNENERKKESPNFVGGKIEFYPNSERASFVDINKSANNNNWYFNQDDVN